MHWFAQIGGDDSLALSGIPGLIGVLRMRVRVRVRVFPKLKFLCTGSAFHRVPGIDFTSRIGSRREQTMTNPERISLTRAV